MRIISLVPSQTELLFHLGLNEQVVGITKFCVHPNEWYKTKTRIGGTKTINVEKIKSLAPTLVLANKEENVQEQVEALKSFTEVYVSDISTLEDALEMIEEVGLLTGKKTEANKMVAEIKAGFKMLKPFRPPIPAAYFIWQKPYMVAGGDTFISDLMTRCGFTNIFQNQNRYPACTFEDLKNLGCQIILLSSEPFPFMEKHKSELEQQLPGVKIVLTDGEMFSWYGSRLLKAPAYFNQLIGEINS